MDIFSDRTILAQQAAFQDSTIHQMFAPIVHPIALLVILLGVLRVQQGTILCKVRLLSVYQHVLKVFTSLVTSLGAKPVNLHVLLVKLHHQLV